MASRVGLRKIAGHRNKVPHLCKRTGSHDNTCPNSIAFTSRQPCLDGQPIVFVAAIIPQKPRRIVQVNHQQVKVSIVVVIAVSGTTSDVFISEIGARFIRDVHKTSRTVISHEHIFFRIFMVGVTVGDEDIQITVAVIIEQNTAPPGVLPADNCKAGRPRAVFEIVLSVHKKTAVSHVGNINIEPAVTVYIPDRRAHRRNPLPPFSKSQAHHKTFAFECPLARVLKIIVLHRVVGNIDVQESIIVQVCKCSTHRSSVWLENSRFFGDISKSSITIVTIQGIRLASVAERAGITRRRIVRAKFAAVIFEIICDIYIKVSIAVIIKPWRRKAPA